MEIKFRAWDKQLKCWNDDILIDSDGWLYTKELGTIVCLGSELQERYELVRFTCLKDKNGKEIFEGYIVHVKWILYPGNLKKRSVEREGNCTIAWSHSHTGFFLWGIPENDMDDGEMFGCRSIETEVIGNIYENPELLEGE